MDETAKLLTAQDYLRLVYAADFPGLRTLIGTIAAGAFNSVTITGDSFESKTHHGQLTFEKALYLRAAMNVYREFVPADFENIPVSGSLTTFATQIVGT